MAILKTWFWPRISKYIFYFERERDRERKQLFLEEYKIVFQSNSFLFSTRFKFSALLKKCLYSELLSPLGPNMTRYGVYLCIQFEYRKIKTRIISNTDAFYIVQVKHKIVKLLKLQDYKNCEKYKKYAEVKSRARVILLLSLLPSL